MDNTLDKNPTIENFNFGLDTWVNFFNANQIEVEKMFGKPHVINTAMIKTLEEQTK